MTIAIDRPFTTGEKPAALSFTFTDASGNAIDLTGYTAQFCWRPYQSARADATSATADVDADPTTGTVTYTWTGDEFAVAGPHIGEFVVGDGTNRFISDQIRWSVRLSVADPVPSI